MHKVKDTRVEQADDGTLKIAFLVDGHWSYVERFPLTLSHRLIQQLDETSAAAHREAKVSTLH